MEAVANYIALHFVAYRAAAQSLAIDLDPLDLRTAAHCDVDTPVEHVAGRAFAA